MEYKCKHCGKRGMVHQLRHHYCGTRGYRSYSSDNDLLTTLLVVNSFGDSESSLDIPGQSSFSGFSGGESGGGGASKDWDSSSSDSGGSFGPD